MPLVEALLEWERAGGTSFHTPGHRQGRELSHRVAALLPQRLFTLDATEVPGLDDLHDPRGAIAQAQRLLAQEYGADESFFLVGGSTAGILAAVLAAGGPGQKLLMARYSHRAAFAAAILAGCKVRYLPERWGGDGLPRGPCPQETAEAVRKWRPAALLLTRPNYHGIAFPLQGVVHACREVGTVLVVDEAHGAHWQAAGLPCALEAGADIVVQSAHKTLPALTQAAWLHRRGGRVDAARLRDALRMVQSSSPSYLLMASLDAARWHLGRWRAEARGRLEGLHRLRERLEEAGIPLLPRGLPPGWVHDPLRLVVDAGAMGWSGPALAASLREAGIEAEWAEPHRVLLLLGLTPGPDEEHLVQVLLQIARGAGEVPGGADRGGYPRLEKVMDPAGAWWAARELIPLEGAAGRIAADLLWFSPPGVPVVVPGERWTHEAVTFLRRCEEVGVVPMGWPEPARVRVVRRG